MSQTTRLTRRNGIYHYRRRVPAELVSAIGRHEIHKSLGTASLAEAKKLRALEDLKWDARFHDASGTNPQPAIAQKTGEPLAGPDALRLVRQFVARIDQGAEQEALTNPPASEEERSEMRETIGIGLTILQDRDDPRADEWIDSTMLNISGSNGQSATVDIGFSEIVRRGLLELQRRKLARLEDNYASIASDEIFAPGRSTNTSFGQVASQFLKLTEEEAKINRTSQKWVHKQKANVALLTEIVGYGTSIRQVDYDECLRVRSVLARLPANRSKLYEGLTIEQSIAAAEADGKAGLSSTTQSVYLSTLQAILELALRKGLVPVNPTQGLRGKHTARALEGVNAGLIARQSGHQSQQQLADYVRVPRAPPRLPTLDHPWPIGPGISAGYPHWSKARPTALALCGPPNHHPVEAFEIGDSK